MPVHAGGVAEHDGDGARAGVVERDPLQGHAAVEHGSEFFIDNLLVRIHCIIVMIKWTGLASWEFEFPFPGSLTSTLGQPPNSWCTRFAKA